jgi:hypothetical protein
MPSPVAPTDFRLTRMGLVYKARLSRHSEANFMWTRNEPSASASYRFEAGEFVSGIMRWGADVPDGFTTTGGSGLSSVSYLNFPTPGPWPGSGSVRYWFFRVRCEFPDGSFSQWVIHPALPPEGSTAAQFQSTAIKFPSFPTSAAAIPPPTNLAVAGNDHSGVRLTWTDNANNESSLIINLTGPGLPTGGVDVVRSHLSSGFHQIPVGYPFQGAYTLQHAATYTAKVKSRGGIQTTAANTFDTVWSNEVTFTTAPASIALVNVPQRIDVPRGQPFSFRVLTNVAPTSIAIVSGALPPGLALVGDTISGTSTAPEATYEVGIKVSDQAITLTEDTQTLTLNLITPAFHFTNLPAVQTAWPTVPFVLQLKTNTPASTLLLTSGELPAGLALTGDTISGTVAAAPGDYFAAFTATNALSSTTGTLLVTVRELGIEVFVKPHGSSAPPQAGPDWGEVVAPLAQPFHWEISALPIGPIEVGDEVVIEQAPAWLTLDGANLIGTPDTSGTSEVLIRWTSGAISGETALRIRVPDVQITSAEMLAVLEDEPFAFALTSLPAARFSTPDSLPRGVGLKPDHGDARLEGRALDVGRYGFRLVATLGREIDTQDFTLVVRSRIEVGGEAGEINGWQGDTLIEMLSYLGAGDVVHWFLTGAPPGVEINPLTCPGGPYAEDNLAVVAITGAPTAAGIFEAVVTAQVCLDGIPRLYRRGVRFLVSGGLFLNWFHDDASHRDLQVLLRSREVRSYSFAGQEGLWLKRGDHASLHVIFRDGPLGAEAAKSSGGSGGGNGSGNENSGGVVVIIGSNNNTDTGTGDTSNAGTGGAIFGRNLITSIASVRLVIRPAVDPEETVLLDLAGEPTTIAGRAVFAFDFQVSSDELESAITREARKVTESPASVILPCVGEIVWERNGQPDSSRSFPVTLVQDIAR